MAMPVKVSDELLTAAKQEAQAANRSITAQIEHWAMIGRAVEVILAHRELLGLKSAGRVLAEAFPSANRREAVHDLLKRIVENPAEREKAKSLIRRAGTPVYATDPNHPGMISRLSADGTRVPGKFQGRRFVPDDGESGKNKG